MHADQDHHIIFHSNCHRLGNEKTFPAFTQTKLFERYAHKKVDVKFKTLCVPSKF